MTIGTLKWSAIASLLLFGVVAGGTLRAQNPSRMPLRAKGIGIDEKLGGFISSDLKFSDENGVSRRLGDLIDGEHPVLLSLNYSGCPGLCVAQLDGLVNGIENLRDLSLGKDFTLLSISIDPRETAEKATGTKKKYTEGLSERHDRKAWHFWTGSPEAIAKITEEVGFRYTYDKEHDRYDHAAVAVAISPKGKITRYLYEVGFEPATIKLVLLEASEGKIGTSLDSFILWCMHFDPNENRYSADARKLLSLTAGVFVLIVLGSVAPFWFSKKNSDNISTVVSSEDVLPSPAVLDETAGPTKNASLEEKTTV